MSKQKTLKGSFSLCGKGLHTGLSLTVTFNPAPENTGYKIQRIDLEGEPVIQAVAENVVETQRGTVLGKGDIRVSTIEHGMSALYALGIDNCLIQVNGPEFPILDGSAAPYVEKIQSIGIQEQNAEKDYYIIRHKIEVKDDNGSVITILPRRGLQHHSHVFFREQIHQQPVCYPRKDGDIRGGDCISPYLRFRTRHHASAPG